MLTKFKKELGLLYNSCEQSQNGKRLTFLDMLKGIAILLVVLGHTGLIPHAVNTWLSTFHLPAFFIVSGMLMQLKKEEEVPLNIIFLRKIKSILLPYVWFSLAALVVDILMVITKRFSSDTLSEHILQTFTLQGYSVLWFLPVLFISEIIGCALLHYLNKSLCDKMKTALIALCVSVLLACVSFTIYNFIAQAEINPHILAEFRIIAKALIAVSFIIFGYLTGLLLFEPPKDNQKSPADNSNQTGDFHLLSFMTGLILSAVNICVLPYIQLMDLNNVNIHNPILYIGLGVTGTLGILFICKGIPNIPLLTFLGQNSLIIMCTHMHFFVFYISYRICFKLLTFFLMPQGILLFAGSMFFTLILEILLILFIRMFLPFMIGGKYKTK